MKALLVGLAILVAAVGAVMTPSGPTSTASADSELCLSISPRGPGLPADLIPLPAMGASFDFTDACERLSDCYLQGAEPLTTLPGAIADKYSCDQVFLRTAYRDCDDWLAGESFSLWNYNRCLKIVPVYYDTFRLFGWSYFRRYL